MVCGLTKARLGKATLAVRGPIRMQFLARCCSLINQFDQYEVDSKLEVPLKKKKGDDKGDNPVDAYFEKRSRRNCRNVQRRINYKKFPLIFFPGPNYLTCLTLKEGSQSLVPTTGSLSNFETFGNTYV